MLLLDSTAVNVEDRQLVGEHLLIVIQQNSGTFE